MAESNNYDDDFKYIKNSEIVTLETGNSLKTIEEINKNILNMIQSDLRSKKILTGQLSGVEFIEDVVFGVTYYNDSGLLINQFM